MIDDYNAFALLKTEFNQYLEKLKKDGSFEMSNPPNVFEGYSGKDIEIFNNRENWHPWQKDVYEMLFHKSGEILDGNDREIISLYDETGNTGKSSFFKYLYFHHSDEIGRITYGTAS